MKEIKKHNKNLWYSNYEDVCKYMLEHKCSLDDIPEDALNSNGNSILKWVLEMRRAVMFTSSYKLTDEQVTMLKDIGITKMMTAHEKQWYLHFNDLILYYEQNHEYSIPSGVECSDGCDMHAWLQVQRNRYRAGKLSEKYVKEFADHGLIQMIESSLDTAMRHIEEYYQEHGNLDFDRDYVCPDGYRLGDWFRVFRAKYQKNQNKKPYPQDVINRLEQMGVVWNKFEDRWHNCFYICKEYLDTHEGCMIPENLKSDNGTNISIWLQNNRKLYRKGELSVERSKMLESIHIMDIEIISDKKKANKKIKHKNDTSSNEDQKWFANFQKCKEYLDANGGDHLPVDMKTVSGTEMNRWFYINRSRYRKGILSKKKAVLFETLNIDDIRFVIPEDQKKSTKKPKPIERNKALHVDLTDEEYSDIKAKAKQNGYASVSEYVRAMLLGKKTL